MPGVIPPFVNKRLHIGSQLTGEVHLTMGDRVYKTQRASMESLTRA